MARKKAERVYLSLDEVRALVGTDTEVANRIRATTTRMTIQSVTDYDGYSSVNYTLTNTTRRGEVDSVNVWHTPQSNAYYSRYDEVFYWPDGSPASTDPNKILEPILLERANAALLRGESVTLGDLREEVVLEIKAATVAFSAKNPFKEAPKDELLMEIAKKLQDRNYGCQRGVVKELITSVLRYTTGNPKLEIPATGGAVTRPVPALVVIKVGNGFRLSAKDSRVPVKGSSIATIAEIDEWFGTSTDTPEGEVLTNILPTENGVVVEEVMA